MAKKRTTVTLTRNTTYFNRSFAKRLKFVDELSDDEIDKMLGD